MRIILLIGSYLLALAALLVYGHWFYPEDFQKRVPWTNRSGANPAE
jgi:hypothetical protein